MTRLFPHVLIGLPLLLVTAGCQPRFDSTLLESDVKRQIEQQGRRITVQAVDCPAFIEQRAGVAFQCTGRLEPEGVFTVNVIQQNNQGNVVWEIPNSDVLLNLQKIEASVQEDLGQEVGVRAAIDCGDTYRLNVPGDTFECNVIGDVRAGGDYLEAILVKIDSQGNLTWQEMRRPQVVAASVSPNPSTTTANNPSTPPQAPAKPDAQVSPTAPPAPATDD